MFLLLHNCSPCQYFFLVLHWATVEWCRFINFTYKFLLSHHDGHLQLKLVCLFVSTNFHLLVIIGLTLYDRLCYLFSFARPWCFFAVSLYSCTSISCSWSAPVLSCSIVKSSVFHFVLLDLEQMVSWCTMYKFYFVGLTKILHVFVLEFTPIV